ncbi:MAG: hypothetical protein HZA90_03490 [Verrucomicrobia bacterium]|nr:hypothetical protein [Verrucomicrobiota bacterium]
MNSLEPLLKSWKPRSPSARLKARLFPAPAAAHHWEAADTAAHWLTWLVDPRHAFWTAIACLVLLTASALNARSWMRDWAPGETAFPALAVALSNQSASARLTLAQARNVLSAPILSWTKDAPSPSTNRSLDPFRTNHLWPKL